MPARKRTKTQRALDIEWCVDQANRGLGPAQIARLAREPVDPDDHWPHPDDFRHIEDGAERKTAVEAEHRRLVKHERARRKSVSALTDRQVGYDVRQVRQRAIEAAPQAYQAILDRTVVELVRIGMGDRRALMHWNSDGLTLRDSDELNESEAAMVEGVKCKKTTRTYESGDTEETVEIDLSTASKVPALRTLVRHMGGYLEIRVPVDDVDPDSVVAGLVERLRKRAGVDDDDGDEDDEE